jgi:putative DNA primase/helicase
MDEIQNKPMLKPEFSGIPRLLKSVPRWVLWRAEERDGRITKPPYTAGGTHASVDNPATWDSYACVSEAYDGEIHGGIGFVLSSGDGLAGIDLDHCVDENGKIDEEAQGIIDAINSYTEFSPSGTGVRIFLTNNGNGMRGNRKGNLEIYTHSRYLTVTGHHVVGTPTTIENRSEELSELHERVFGPEREAVETPTPTAMLNVEEIEERLEIAKDSRGAEKIEKLLAGNTEGYDSHSEADLALCCHLAFWLDKDAVAMDTVFRASGLYRAKWERADYRDHTIGRAIKETRDIFGPGEPPTIPTSESEQEFSTITATEILEMEIPEEDAIIEDLVNKGSSLMILGRGGVGKSTIGLDMLCHIAAGRRMYRTWDVPEPRTVLLVQSENAHRTTQQRLQSFYENHNEPVFLEGRDRIKFACRNDDIRASGDLLKDKFYKEIRKLIQESGAEVVLLDPLVSFHSVNENDNVLMRSVLDQLTKLSSETGAAFIIIHHFGKSKELEGSEKSRGASSITDWARGCLNLEKVKHEHRNLVKVSHVKANDFECSPPFLLEIEGAGVTYTEPDVVCPPLTVQEILREMGGEVEQQTTLVNELRSRLDISTRTAIEGISRAERYGYIRSERVDRRKRIYVE